MLEAQGLSKRFGPVLANDSVNLFLARHSVHAVLGQNGAGKTTLANMLSGLYRPDTGTLKLDGEVVEFRNPPDALARGVGMVHQHARLVDRLTVEENIVLGDPDLPYYLDYSKIRARVRSLMDRYGLAVRVGAYAGELSAGERQRVDLLKTLFRGVDVLLLDEPTAVLVPAEVERLFETIGSFAADGVAVMIITHKLREVMAVSDTVTVMRDGRVEMVIPTGETTAAALATAMIGRPVEHEFSRLEGFVKVGEPVLTARDLKVSRTNNREGLHGITLAVRSGEIVGIAGVAGNGQELLADVLSGLVVPDSGSVEIAGKDTTGGGVRAARNHGLGYIPSDRLHTGLAPDLSVAENLMLTDAVRGGFNASRAQRRALKLIEDYGIVVAGPDVKTGTLSGGNLQRVILARELSGSPEVLVVSSPTQGLDVASAQFVHEEIGRLREEGCAIVLISEDLDEVLALADTVMVLYEGTVAYETAIGDLDREMVGLAMTGSGA